MMLSVVSICANKQKTDEFLRKLIKSDGSIWWGLHIWQEVYEPTGFIDSVRQNVDAYQHWLDILMSNNLHEVLEDAEM